MSYQLTLGTSFSADVEDELPAGVGDEQGSGVGAAGRRVGEMQEASTEKRGVGGAG